MKRLNSTPLFNVLMFSAFWSLQIFIAKLGFRAGALVLPFQVILIISATIVVALLILPRAGKELVELYRNRPRLFWMLFFANGTQAGLGTSLSIIGISLTNAINAGFLVKMATVTTIIFSWLILKESMSRIKIAIVFVMIFGAYLLTTGGQRLLPRVGDLLILAACFCWSLGNVLVRKILKTQTIKADVVTLQKPIASMPVFALLIGISLFYPGSFGSLNNVLTCCSFSISYIPYGIISGICLALAWIFLYRTLHMATASYMTLMSMVTPIIVAVLAMLFLNEKMIWIQGIGAAMILISGVVTYLSDIAEK